jgi:hypothetical protein
MRYSPTLNQYTHTPRRVRQTADMAYQWREKTPEAPRTEILCCVVCRRAYPLRAHDALVCAGQRGIDGGELYVLEHRFARECGRAG